MVVWFASGRSLVDWIRPVLVFSAPFVIVVSIVVFVAALGEPPDHRIPQPLRAAGGRLAGRGGPVPGVRVGFVEFSSSNPSAKTSDGPQRVRDPAAGGRLTIVVAASGAIEDGQKGDRFLVLEKGRRYDGEAAAPAFRLMEFERYGLRLEPRETTVRDVSAKARGTLDLLSDPTPRNLGELLWRIGMPVSAVVLALLAIPLSSFNPRAGRSVNLIVALLVYVTYSNLLSLSQAWVSQGKASFAIAVWAIHAALIAVASLLFWRRLTLARVRVRVRLPWRRGAAA